MSSFSAADPRTKNIYAGNYGVERMSYVLNQVASNHSDAVPYATPTFYVDDAPCSRSLTTGHLELRNSDRPQQAQSSSFRPPHRAINSNFPVLGTIYDLPAQRTVRVPLAPRSCPPCSPVTRIVPSVTADGTVSPGTKTVSFEVDNAISDDHINVEVQALREKLEKKGKPQYEVIPVLHLKDPPKGKGKRPLSSDSDSFSSDLTNSSVSFNSSVTSDSFQKSLKSPEDIHQSGAMPPLKSPKKIKGEGDSVSPARKLSDLNRPQSEDKGIFQSNDCTNNFLKLPVFTFPQSPSKTDNFCSTPLEQAARNQKITQPSEKSHGRLESKSPYRNVDSREARAEMMRRTSSSPGLHAADSDFHAIHKSLSMPKADVHNREIFKPGRLKTVDNPKSGQVSELSSENCGTKQSLRFPSRPRKSLEPNVFIFPDVKKSSNEDEVDGFGSDTPMDMDVDCFEDRGFQFGQHNQFHGTGSFQGHQYGLNSNQSQTQQYHSQARYPISMANYEHQNQPIQPSRFPRGDSTFYRNSDTVIGSAHAGSGSFGRFYGDDLDSGGTPQSRARQKGTEVVKTPKDNRTKVALAYEDILDISEKHEDVEQALGKFSDLEGHDGRYMCSKQDFNNNNSSKNGPYNNRQFGYEESYNAAFVNTRADTNVCFVAPHELPDSDMSCDDMEDYGDQDYEDAGLAGYTPGHSGRHQRHWDETDSSLCVREGASKSRNKSSNPKIDSPSKAINIAEHQSAQTCNLKVSKEKSISSEKKGKEKSPYKSSNVDYGEVSQHTRHIRSSSLNEANRNRSSESFPKDYNNSCSLPNGQQVQTRPQLNSSPGTLIRAATVNKASDNRQTLPVETKTNMNRFCADMYGSADSPIRNNRTFVGQPRENAHPTPIHKHAEKLNPRQGSFKQPKTYGESKTLRHHPWVPASTGRSSSYVYDEDVDDCSSGGDEVDGLGDGKAAKPIREFPGPSSPPSKRAAVDAKDDVVHCFDTSDHEDGDQGETVPARQTMESVSSRMQHGPFQTIHARSSDFVQNAEPLNEWLNSARAGFTPKKSNNDVGFRTPVCISACNTQTDVILPCIKPNLLNTNSLAHTETVFLESSPHSRACDSSRESQLRNKHHGVESKDDISLSCNSSQELRDIFPRRASDTSGTISPNHVIPRTRSSPSKLENNSSGDKLRKVTFHRPWVTTDETKINSQSYPFNVLELGSNIQSIVSTQGDIPRIVNTSGFPPMQNYRTPEGTGVARYSSISDPNRHSDFLRSEVATGRTGRVDAPAKRNRVDRRLDFESAHQIMDKGQLKGAAADPSVTGTAQETTSSPSAAKPERARSVNTGSASTFREYDDAHPVIEINENPEGASHDQLDGAGTSKTAGNRGEGSSSVSETGTRLKRIQSLITSRGESGNSREDKEIDIKIEVSDSLRLSQRLEQIYQSNETRCECARIELEILSKAMDLFGELCDPSKRFENWKTALRDTNAVIRDSLEVADDCRRLCSHGRTVSDVFPGSVVLRVKCRTLTSVVDLRQMHSSGELQGLLCRMLCARVQMKGLALKVSMDPENLESCTRCLLRALQLPEKSNKSSPRKACPDGRSGQGLNNCVRSSPSTPTVRIPTHTRCSSSPTLYMYSPILAPKPVTPDRRERTFSFGETRRALQELDGPTSPLGSSSRWNCSPRQASSPLPPHLLRTSPLTSPVTSPRKLKRCDVIQEQENLGGGGVDFAS